MTLCLPSYAYVPGVTDRHPEDAFAEICASVVPGMSASELARTCAWRTGLLYLDKGYYWEAHEVFEPIWMALPKGSHEGLLVQALIHWANARLKRRMGRARAVARLYQMGLDVLSDLPVDQLVMGLSAATLIDKIEAERVGKLLDYEI